MIKNIVFDMGNVLIPFEPPKYLSTFVANEKDREILYNEVFRSIEWVKTDSGDLTVAQAVQAVQRRMPPHLHTAIADLFERWSELVEPYADMQELVRELYEKKYKIYLLSNISPYYYELRKKIPAAVYFSGEFLSAEHHTMKPYPEAYQKFFAAFDLLPAECFFIDDLPSNIFGAANAGMAGTVYHGSVPQLRETLQRMGVL